MARPEVTDEAIILPTTVKELIKEMTVIAGLKIDNDAMIIVTDLADQTIEVMKAEMHHSEVDLITGAPIEMASSKEGHSEVDQTIEARLEEVVRQVIPMLEDSMTQIIETVTEVHTIQITHLSI